MSRCIRSVFDAEWMIRAYDDGSLLCTADSRRMGKIFLASPASSLLILLGPQKRAWRLAIGRFDGAIEIRTLPSLELISRWDASLDRITALSSLSRRDSDSARLVCGDSRGVVFVVGDAIPGAGVQPLFTMPGEVSALRVRRDRIDAWSGWHRERRRWTGELIGEISNRNRLQMALPV